MFSRKEEHYTPEEYLALEEEAEYKSEYYQGEIFAMSGASINHNRIAGNIHTAFNIAFVDGSCEAFMGDVRVLVKENGLYTYPDIVTVCGELDFAPDRDDTITNPIVIIEVLSKSTEGYDRGAKFELYRALPTLQDYILVDQYKIHVEQFHRLDDGRWILQEFNQPEDTLAIESVEFEMSIERIYQRVVWED